MKTTKPTETQNVEFKQSWHDGYLEWICGYANAYGGTLYIGRNDDGTPCGVAKAKSLMESIPCKITDTMGIIADVNLLDEEGVEQYMFHPDAFREIVLNAIVHKDYSGGNPIQISVYPDRIYVWNDGTFPPELNTSAKLFGKHSSKPFNPGLAGVFFKCGLIEAWGRGFDKIKAGCEEYGGPRPIYKIGESGVMVLCKACPAYLELKSTEAEQSLRTAQATTQTTTQRILAIIKTNPGVSRAALSKEIGLSSDGIKWHLQKLKEGNVIRRVGPKYGGHWEVIGET